MRRELDRWREKLTPEEERRTWSRVRQVLQKQRERNDGRVRRNRLHRALALGAVGVVALVLMLPLCGPREAKQTGQVYCVMLPDPALEADSPPEARPPSGPAKRFPPGLRMGVGTRALRMGDHSVRGFGVDLNYSFADPAAFESKNHRFGVTLEFLDDDPEHPSLTGGERPVNDELADEMLFEHVGTNPFVETEEDSVSTFGLDVDTGSYTMARSYIEVGHLPPPSAIRAEEFLNFFRRGYEPPRQGDFRIHLAAMPSPFSHSGGEHYRLLRVGIRGRVIAASERLPAQILLVIDASGSMEMGNRLELVKASLDILLGELRPDDELGIVAFDTSARLVRPLGPVTEAEDARRAIAALKPQGSTNLQSGLALGYDTMRDAARPGWIQTVILCSDGVANVGHTAFDSILESVREASDRITLTTIGFGMGNYNDVLMERLADAGDGQYAYVDDLREAERVLQKNLTGTLQVIARDAKAQVTFDPRRVVRYRLLGYENRDIPDEEFRDNRVDAGEIGAGHEVTVLYEVKLRGDAPPGRLATARLRYETPVGAEFVELEETLRLEDIATAMADAPADLILDACVAEFAEILRRSYWAKGSSPAAVLDLLHTLPDSLGKRPEVAEFVGLVERAGAIEP